MERLNDIMSRATQRRHQLTEQRSSQRIPGQRPQQLGTRRRLPEQTAHLDQQQEATYGPQQHSVQPSSMTRVPQNESNGRELRPSPLYSQRSSHPASSKSGGMYQQHPHPLQETQRPQPRQYHRSDDYTARPRADALEEWNEDEDGATGMRYGDWEGAEEEARPHEPPDRAHPVSPRSSHMTRDLQSMSPLPQPPVSRGVEGQRYSRHTQPLNPQMIASMGREREMASEQQPVPRSTSIAPHPTQQVVVHEQLLQYAPVAVPPPLSARSVCPLCKGAGYLRVDVPFGHPNFGKPVACECKEAERKEKRRQELLELSELSAFRNTSFKNFNVRFPGVHPSVVEAFQGAYDFAQNPGGWLVLIGPNGCGKTHLAASIANQRLNDGAVVLFTIVPDLLAHLRSTFSPHATEAYDQRFAKMREAELLVLDDLGAHQGSPWASEKLFQLLNYRYNLGYPTVITANRQGWSSIDERIQSRLSDTGLVTIVVLNGALDYRRQNPRRDWLR